MTKKSFNAFSLRSLAALILAALLPAGCTARAAEPLTLAPGITQRGQKPPTWTLDLTDPANAPKAARSLSSRLYGTGEPGDLHAPLVIQTPGANQIFGVGIDSVSRNGATLQMRLDGQAAWTKTWPAADGTHAVDTTYYFTLPAKPAKVELEVTDERGVVVLKNLVLAPNVAALSGKTEAMQIATTPAAPATRRVDGYRGIWFELGKKFEFGDKYSGGLGTYTADHQPLAVYSKVADKTFFVYGGTTQSDERHLLAMVGYYDHKTGLVPKPVVVFDKETVDDPHDNPVINIDKDGYLWVFVSGRNTSRLGLKFRSKQPYSIDDWEQIAAEEMTYPQLWVRPDGDFFNFFTRYTAGRELYFETSQDGHKWSEDAKLAGFGGHYGTSGQWNGKVATFFNYHPGGDVDKRTNLYYAQSTDNGVTWTSADGTKLELPLDQVNNPALVIDYQARGEFVYTCDLNWDAQGNPLLLYVASKSGLPGPQGNPRAFRLTRWDGARWITTQVAPTDHNYDMGSLYVEGDLWKVIAPALPGPQPGQQGGEMALYSSTDRGATWKMTRQITRNSARNQSYARRPENANPAFAAFWADGDPTKFSPSHLYFCDASGQNVFELPAQIEGDFAKPIAVKIQAQTP